MSSSRDLEDLTSYEGDCPQCFSTMFPDESIDDGSAIMGHDAVLLAITAIRRAGASTRSAKVGEVSPSGVIQVLSGVRSATSAEGASGRLSMSRCGDAEGKLFPLLSLGADGHSSLIKTVMSRATLPC